MKRKAWVKPVLIREARIEDCDRVLAILRQLRVLNNPDLPPEAEFIELYRPTYLKLLGEPDKLLLVAEDETGEVVAYAGFGIDWVLHHNGRRALLEEIVVDRNCRARGTGTRMLEYAMARFKEQDIKVVELASSLRHPGQAEFYEKNGFKVISNYLRRVF